MLEIGQHRCCDLCGRLRTAEVITLAGVAAQSGQIFQLFGRFNAFGGNRQIHRAGEIDNGFQYSLGLLAFMLDLGLLLIRSTGPEERERFIRQIVVVRCLENEAATRAIEVTEAEARAEVQARKEAADRDARYGGLRLEQVLLSQGMTTEELVHWPVLRAQIIERKLVDMEQSPDDLRASLEENRADVLKLHGPRRQLAFLFTRAVQEPNELVARDFAAAEKHLGQIREQLRDEGIPFSAAALQHSEDPVTSMRGGAAGWHRQTSLTPSPEVIEAAFALDRGGISDPIRTAEGYYLVKVVDIEPMPRDEQLIESLHRVLQAQLRQRILEQAQIELL